MATVMTDTTKVRRIALNAEQGTRYLAAVGVVTIVLIAFLTLFDVGLRSLFSTTIRGLNEILILALGVAIAACLPSGAARAVHISLDLVTARLPGHAARALSLMGTVLLTLFLMLVGIEVFQLATTYDSRDQASIILGWQIAPFYYAMATLVLICIPIQIVHAVDAGVEIMRTDRGLWRPVEFVPSILILAVACLVYFDALDLLPGYDWFRSLQAGVAALVFFAMMWALMVMGVPLAASMGIVGFLGTAILLAVGPAGTVVGSEAGKFFTSETLAVLPLFLLMGSFASVAGLSADIYRFANELMRPMRGALAHATIAGCAGFGALTGSSLATAATFGKVALPEMQSRNYDQALATGSVAAGGTLGSLVPPSTALILFALLSEQSIGQLFVAAMIPAALAIALYLVAIKVLLTLRPGLAPEGSPIDGKALLAAAKGCIGAFVLFGAVIGGIYTGIVTDAEAASVGAVGAFLFALFRGRLGGGQLWNVMAETTTTIALIYTLIFGAVTFSFLIAFTQVPAMLSGWIVGMEIGPYGVIALLVVVYLILGMVMDSYAMMVITVPIFLPLVTQMGFDPIWWGVVTVICVEMGMITPPFGMNIFMLSSIAKNVHITTIYRGVAPFVLVDLIKVGALILFPALALWLPSHM
ncbi:tripartite ATP-independent transporter DctM subunit [Maritimibacter alkaliphilus HTCC2654]|nr:tripartite ATP-independent transporter DctM subunit [Maritimibacter alkaliphilus HTCC2654]